MLKPFRDQRPSSTQNSVYDVEKPTTSYASAFKSSALHSMLTRPFSSNRTSSAVVVRRPRMGGLDFHYSHGGMTMPLHSIPRPASNGVASSRFQTINVTLHDWCVNRVWYAAGYPRNLGYATRVSQLETNQSGGSTDASMGARPLFPRVQVVPRYSVRPATYATRSSRG